MVPTLVLSGCAWLENKQNQIALRPTPGKPAGMADDSVLFRPADERQLLSLASAANAPPQQLAIWWLPNANPQAPALLYLHGTFRNLYSNLSKINALRDAGFSVLAVDYRGWGDSTFMVPSEDSIAQDTLTAWRELQRRQPNPQRRVIFGHSMGGAVAVRLASTLHSGADYGALVLESTFTNMPDVASAVGFWGRVAGSLITLQFDSAARVGRIDAPILMLHGTADKTVPIELGRALRIAAPPGTRWLEFHGGSHSQLHSEFKTLYTQTFQDLAHRLSPRNPP